MVKNPNQTLSVFFLFLVALLITGCNNAYFEKDTRVQLIDGSIPPAFEIKGNGTSPIFLVFGPYEGGYGKDGNPLPVWEIDPERNAQGIEAYKYSPFTYGQIPKGYIQNNPKDGQTPVLLEGKEYRFYVHVNSANGGGTCFRIYNQKAIKCK